MAGRKKEKFNQVKYQNEYNRLKYDRVGIVMPKGKKDVVKEKATAAGQSMNEYVNQAIEERMEREGVSDES